MRILGIDPALRVTGYGALTAERGKLTLLEGGIVSPNVDDTLERRLAALHDGLCAVFASVRPDVVVIEDIYTTYRNPRTAILMGHARGVMCLAAAQANVPVQTLGHSRVKNALVGSGSARKDQVNAMVTHMLGLRQAPKPNDVSDALALAIAWANIVAR
ncbi:MAG: crossover junction endodeoxyribonuclease RuvC [Vulcanimicrobiaceae bacterium]